MIISKLDTIISGEPIWKYERDEGTFYVRIRGKTSEANNFIIKSPSGKLYAFYEYYGEADEAIKEIIDGKADCSEHECSFESIYD